MHIGYEIYDVSEDGLLKRPHKYSYGNKYPIFDTCKTMEEAMEAIIKEDVGKWGHIILPVAIPDPGDPD